MFDDLGIVYLIENAQQFWTEIEDILHILPDSTLSVLDATLKRFISFCSGHHEQYLQSPLQIEHACDLLIDSELFSFHSERMCEHLLEDARTNTDPHCQLILFNILITYGRRQPNFLRSQKKWQPLLPLFMDYVLMDIDPDVEDTYAGSTSAASPGWSKGAGSIPIEAKLRLLSVRLLYEVCRVQKLSITELRIFDDSFLDFLFDLVEETRNLHDDTFNYSVIKLIVALNEQFMVATMPMQSRLVESRPLPSPGLTEQQAPESRNRVFRVLMRRLNSSMTFGENMIFMLNRASNRSMEDRCMQVLVLKLLYLLFTTPGTSEYFYTNDLCVLVDVFLRELLDLDDESESLRHTFLRVLHPLLTKTQLRAYPYKRPQVVRALECLVGNAEIRDIDPTTKRLVERCLGGDWCVQFQSAHPVPLAARRGPYFAAAAAAVDSDLDSPTASQTDMRIPERRPSHRRAPSTRRGGLKNSRSAEQLSAATKPAESPAPHRALDNLRRAANDSLSSLPIPATSGLAAGGGPPLLATRKQRSDSTDMLESTIGLESRGARRVQDTLTAAAADPGVEKLTRAVDGILSLSDTMHAPESKSGPMSEEEVRSASPPVPKPRRRAAPPAPPKQRRKPPPAPTRKAGGVAGIARIAPSSSQPALMQSWA